MWWLRVDVECQAFEGGEEAEKESYLSVTTNLLQPHLISFRRRTDLR